MPCRGLFLDNFEFYLCWVLLLVVNVEEPGGELAARAAWHVDLSSVSGELEALQLRSHLIHKCQLKQDLIIRGWYWSGFWSWHMYDNPWQIIDKKISNFLFYFSLGYHNNSTRYKAVGQIRWCNCAIPLFDWNFLEVLENFGKLKEAIWCSRMLDVAKGLDIFFEWAINYNILFRVLSSF